MQTYPQYPKSSFCTQSSPTLQKQIDLSRISNNTQHDRLKMIRIHLQHPSHFMKSSASNTQIHTHTHTHTHTQTHRWTHQHVSGVQVVLAGHEGLQLLGHLLDVLDLVQQVEHVLVLDALDPQLPQLISLAVQQHLTGQQVLLHL